MNTSTFNACTQELLEHCRKIRDSKGIDYTDGEDRLSNFKTNAKRWCTNPRLVWAIYFGKHLDAIASHVHRGQVESEPIKDRIADAINYLILYWALINDSGPGPVPRSPEPALIMTEEGPSTP